MSSPRSFRFPFKFNFTGGHKKQHSTNSFGNESTNVGKEYHDVFRTNSYLDICHKVQTHIGSFSSSSSSCDDDHYNNFRQFDDDILFEPETDTMANLAATFDHMHPLILDFLNAGSESWNICEKLLQSIHQANANHQRIRSIIETAKTVPKTDHRQHEEIQKELDHLCTSTFANPNLSDFSPKTRDQFKPLLKRLRTNRTRVKRKRKLIICLKKGMGCALVGSYTVLAVALLVLSFHGLVGLVAHPGLVSCILGLVTNKAKVARKGLKTGELKRVGVLLDVAAKGVYTLIKDFDMIGSLAGRLDDEVEFGRAVARNCVGNLKCDALEEVMREFRVYEKRFMEQLEELKDHIYLCLLNVNRSRMAFVKEMVHA